MKRLVLTMIVCVSAVGQCFAQNNVMTMKSLTVTTLMQYGQKLYDRGDYNEATAVFDHVLTYDSHQAQALQYLKNMGHLPAPYLSVVTHPQSLKPGMAVQRVDIADTKSLQEAIEVQKQIIRKLQDQIKQMRANLASQSAGRVYE